MMKLNEAYPTGYFGPDFTFPKTRGNYKGGKVQPVIIDSSYLYSIDRPLKYVGWIKSQSKLLKTWKSGYCVLENGKLCWYRDENLTQLKRTFSLKDVTIAYNSDQPSIPLTCARITLPSGRGQPGGQNVDEEDRIFLMKFEEKIARSTWLSYLRSHQEWANR